MKQKEVKTPFQKKFLNSIPKEHQDFFHIPEELLSNLSEIVIQATREGIIISANRPVLGIPTDKLIGKNLVQVFTDDVNKIENIYNSVIQTRLSQQIKYKSTSCKKLYSINFVPVREKTNYLGLFLIFNDITESKFINETKTFESDFTSKLIDIANFIVLVLDRHGKIIRVNQYFEETTGYMSKEIEGKDWFATFLPKDDHGRIKKVFKQTITDTLLKTTINCIITKNGKRLTIEWYNKTLTDSDGNVIGTLSVGMDITERLASENALQTSTTQLAAAMNIAKIGYWEYNFKNDLFTFNDQFYSVFQTNVDEVGSYTMSLNQYLELFVHIEDRNNIRKFIKNAKDLNNIPDGDLLDHRTKFKDGTLAYISLRIITLRDNDSNIIKISGAIQDITERVKYEEALRESEAQLSNAMHIAQLGYWEYDVASNLFTFNDHFYSIFRTSVQEVGTYTMTPEQYAKRFLYPDDLNMVADETRKAIEATDPNYSRQLEHRILYADGELGYISVRFFIVKNSEGRTIKTFGANQDITERKKIEKELEDKNAKYIALNLKLEESLDIVRSMNIELENAKNKAEENDKLKSAFLANMSHEIRTPMNGIIGFAKMLNRQGLSDERRLQYTDIINEMSHQLLHMIDEIIDISKIETGQIVVHKTKTNINDMFIRLFSQYKSAAEKNNLSLYVQKGLSDSLSEIFTDNSKLRQILENLLRNAFKFTHQGYVKFGYSLQDDGNLEFYVEDTGIGIPPEMQVAIFERFRQAEEGVGKVYGGTGLGLSISKSFIEKLGGTIWVKSIPEKGSTFHFTIPYKPATIGGVHFLEEFKNNNYQNTPTILVVEDEEINYLYIEEVLIESNIKIFHAKRGKEAIEIVKANPNIDLVLLDIKLPDISGMDVLKELKEMRPLIPIIAQTAYALSGDMEIALETGFDDYIAKPIDDQELLNKVSQYISLNKSNYK